ncbi:DNA repair protein RecN (Recombination protein N) [Prosthecobacter debontii]|uniref:DNA repair protein RecN n=1 Tax=Prosthecobacter debontii TaxID=48467 RepID=A0A1T4WTE3_9BACT|nr:DNA repair protein RecN [Prosthecobacter debontii]SKA80633.1 DNA repair protein RecN (Recombination protein N) [Prosthecobacter debontii]
MLSFIKIRHLALVEDVTWDLRAGLIGVTGETGAGKSIIVGALKLILGERADRSLIRNGQDTCTVEASFHLNDTRAVDAVLEEAGLEPCQDGELLIKRSISTGGANKQFVNCSPVTIQVLKALGEHLVDLHGPHDHQSLNSQDRQLEMLDKYIGSEDTLTHYQTAWQQWRAALTELDELENSERSSSQQEDMLRFQAQEIAAADLKPGEEEEIEGRHRIAANGARLAEVCSAITGRLSDGEGGILDALREIGRHIHELEKIDPSTASMFEGFKSAQIELTELESSVQEYADDLETDPEELARLDQRIHTIQTLKRKYGSTVEAILQFQQEAEQKLSRIENRGEELERLQALVKTRRAEVDKLGKQLTKKRADAAPKLAKEVAAHLTDLGFKRSVFEAQLIPQKDPARSGLEEVDFQFAPNPGEPLKPLRLTASSGEMSRVLLAVKSALAKQDAVPLLVFDEIDANVGGNIAEAVGHKMASLGSTHQVIAITHFPQVASLAGSHFVVTKEIEGDRTKSNIREVTNGERVEELARMLGGKIESAREHARNLLVGHA